MPNDNNVLWKIIVPIFIALIVSSTAPWWWRLLFGEDDEPAPPPNPKENTVIDDEPAPPPNPEENTVIVDPKVFALQFFQIETATKDYHEGKKIIVRYDIKADVNTIQEYNLGSDTSTRFIKTSLEDESGREVDLRCNFTKEYTPFLKGLNSELFESNSQYTLTLEGNLEDINNVRSSRYSTSMNLNSCKISNINRSG